VEHGYLVSLNRNPISSLKFLLFFKGQIDHDFISLYGSIAFALPERANEFESSQLRTSDSLRKSLLATMFGNN